MPGAEFSNLKGTYLDGNLRFRDLNGHDLITVGATTGVRMMPAGTVLTVTTNATMTLAYSGCVITSEVQGVTITLPAIASTTMGINYTIVNTSPDAEAGIILRSAADPTTNVFIGCGKSSTAVVTALTNAKTTHKAGDQIRVMSLTDPTNSPVWSVLGMVGTWNST